VWTPYPASHQPVALQSLESLFRSMLDNAFVALFSYGWSDSRPVQSHSATFIGGILCRMQE
jgi:hypothetical protein